MGDYTLPSTPPADPVATASAQPDAPAFDPNRPVSTIPADSKPSESPKSSSFGDLIGTPDLSKEPAIHIDPIAPKHIPFETTLSFFSTMYSYYSFRSAGTASINSMQASRELNTETKKR